MNCVDAAALNVAVGKVVCGAAVEGVPGQRRAQKVRSSILSFPVTLSIVSQARPASEVGLHADHEPNELQLPKLSRDEKDAVG